MATFQQRRDRREERRAEVYQPETQGRSRYLSSYGATVLPVDPAASRIAAAQRALSQVQGPVVSSPHAVRATKPVQVLEQQHRNLGFNVPQAAKPQYVDRPSVVQRKMDEKRAERAHVAPLSRDVRASQTLQPIEHATLASKGVNVSAERSNHACLTAHRPVSNAGDGSGRPFVHWCKKGGH